MILLDTNICAAAIRDDRRVASRLIQHAGRVHVPWIVAGELRYGAERLARMGGDATVLRRRIDQIFAMSSGVLHCNDATIESYAALRSRLESDGRIIGGHDLWIAAQALAEDALLITDNVREFKRVPGLRMENWLKR